MPCHYLVVITLQAQDPTASLDTNEGVVAPPPFCLQGLENGIESKQTLNVKLGFGQIQPKTDLKTLQLLSADDIMQCNYITASTEQCSIKKTILTWISLEALW